MPGAIAGESLVTATSPPPVLHAAEAPPGLAAAGHGEGSTTNWARKTKPAGVLFPRRPAAGAGLVANGPEGDGR